MRTEKETAKLHDEKMEQKWKGNSPVEICRFIAAQLLNVPTDSVYTVMFSFVLGGFKAFCSSSALDNDFGTYIEVVYNGEKNEYYAIEYVERYRRTIHAN